MPSHPMIASRPKYSSNSRKQHWISSSASRMKGCSGRSSAQPRISPLFCPHFLILDSIVSWCASSRKRLSRYPRPSKSRRCRSTASSLSLILFAFIYRELYAESSAATYGSMTISQILDTRPNPHIVKLNDEATALACFKVSAGPIVSSFGEMLDQISLR
jgi:hypothetical protein